MRKGTSFRGGGAVSPFSAALVSARTSVSARNQNAGEESEPAGVDQIEDDVVVDAGKREPLTVKISPLRKKRSELPWSFAKKIRSSWW